MQEQKNLTMTRVECRWKSIGPNFCTFQDGFPLKVAICEKICSSLSSSSSDEEIVCSSSSEKVCCILQHKCEKTFWINCGDLSYDSGKDVISKIFFLMDTFCLDEGMQWKVGCRVDIVENEEKLIKKIMTLIKDRPTTTQSLLYLCISKVTYFEQTTFTDLYQNLGQTYNFEVWVKSQQHVDLRIVGIKGLEEKMGIKKLRFDKIMNIDLCPICIEEFYSGSVVCRIENCSHIFHEICLLKWLLQQVVCPLCRSNVEKKIEPFAKISEI